MQSSMKTNSIRVGTIVADRYRLEEPLVRGAMGTIWRAEHLRLKSAVAVKFLDAALITDQEMRGRFMQEARSMAAVRSAHVVQVFDHGIEDGFPFIVMELLEGESLDERLSECGPLSPGQLRKIFAELARALGKAHALGVIHRDLKPANIFLAQEGPYEITKLVDFGIAKVKSEMLQFTHVGTRMGTLLGTPQYMSPEQARGSCTVDFRTDLWALAIVACECLTGRFPFSGKTVGDLTVQICTERPAAPSRLGPVPAGFDAWFFKATAKVPSQRFASIKEMEEALSPILEQAEARRLAAAPARRPRLQPALVQMRELAGTCLRGVEVGAVRAAAFVRRKLDGWFWLLPEERRRILSVAALSACGLTLLAVSNAQHQRPPAVVRAIVTPRADAAPEVLIPSSEPLRVSGADALASSDDDSPERVTHYRGAEFGAIAAHRATARVRTTPAGSAAASARAAHANTLASAGAHAAAGITNSASAPSSALQQPRAAVSVPTPRELAPAVASSLVDRR